MPIFFKNLIFLLFIMCGFSVNAIAAETEVILPIKPAKAVQPNGKKSLLEKFSFLSSDWLKSGVEDVKVAVTVNRLSHRLLAVSYQLEEPVEMAEHHQAIAGFIYCVNRYLAVDSGYIYAALGTEKNKEKENRVNFFIAVLNRGETATKAGTYGGIPWFDKVLSEQFDWQDFVFMNEVSEKICSDMLKPDYSFRLLGAAV